MSQGKQEGDLKSDGEEDDVLIYYIHFGAPAAAGSFKTVFVSWAGSTARPRCCKVIMSFKVKFGKEIVMWVCEGSGYTVIGAACKTSLRGDENAHSKQT